MNVSLTPELERLVQEKVTSGLYQTASEVIREALRLLKERDADRAASQREAIAEGMAQLVQGKYREYTDATLPEVTAGVKARGRARLTAKHETKPV